MKKEIIDCAYCTPELYAHKKRGQTIPICEKHGSAKQLKD